MSGGKQTPRQRMIGMMYLVLTALLALNISKEIINAFITIDNGLKNTNSNFDNKNQMTYTAFEKAKQNDEKKAAIPYANAMKAKKLSADLCAYITSLRGKIVNLSAGFDEKSKVGDTLRLTLLEKPDDYDNPTHFMIGSDPANVTGEAKPLKAALIKYYDDLTKLLPEKSQKDFSTRIKPSVPTEKVYSGEEKEMITWERYNFYHAPIVAAIAQMDRIINDVKNAEGDAVNELFNSVNANDFKFDKLTAKVVAPTSYVFTGDHYTADVFVAAFNSTQNPSIWLCEHDSVKPYAVKPGTPIDSTSVKVEAGMGKYDVVAGGVGLQKWAGLIRVKKPDGTFDTYPFKQEYMVAAPSAAVFLEKMNVFYIGVDNPISISAAGVAPSDLSPSLSGGQMRSSGKAGSYIVTVASGTEATLNVGAKLNGVNKSMGSFKFRVKRVPDPVAYVGSIKADGIMSKAELQATSGVFAKMDNFDFDLKFTVVSFVMSMGVNGVFVEKKAVGPAFTPDMKQVLAGAKPGNRVLFEQVTVKGPDGTLRKIPGVSIKVR